MSRRRPQIPCFTYLFFLIPFLFTACDELGLLNTFAGEPLIQVNLDDSLVHPGEELSILVEAEDVVPDRISVRLEGKDGKSLVLEPASPAEGWVNKSGVSGTLLIPDTVPEGFYTLVSEAWMAEKLLSEERTELFVLKGDWTINSLEFFPPQSVPGGLFYVHALLDLPEGVDPRLRWIQDDVIVAEGLLSEGWGTVLLDAGSVPGVQPLTVELYPDKDNYPVPLRFFSTDLYTSASIPEGKDNLFPADAYVFLQHFDGKLNGSPEISGKPRPVNTPDGMGFRFVSGDGLQWKGIPVPAGKWAPFSLTVGVLPEKESGGRLLKLENEDFSLVLSFSVTWELLLQLNDDEYASDISFPEAGKGTSAVTLSIQPDEEGMNITWLVDGDTVKRDRREPLPAPPGPSIALSLGGDGGFSGIVTELGIRTPGVEPDRFAFYRDSDNEMTVAEGFEDTDLSPGVKIDPGMRIEGGSLVMPPSTSLRFPSGNGEMVLGPFSEKDSLTLALISVPSGEVLKIWGDSSDRTIIPLEKETGITDNEDETFYELRTSGRNSSDLRLEYILVSRE